MLRNYLGDAVRALKDVMPSRCAVASDSDDSDRGSPSRLTCAIRLDPIIRASRMDDLTGHADATSDAMHAQALCGIQDHASINSDGLMDGNSP